MDYVIIAILGFISNRIRGQRADVIFLNQDDINGILYSIAMYNHYSLSWWSLPVLYLSMKLGSATGWTEFLVGCMSRYILGPNEDYNKLSKVFNGYFKPVDQWSTFRYGCLRAYIWVYCLFIGLAICGVVNWWIWLSIPFFYLCYRFNFKTTPKLYFELAESYWGSLLWLICSIA